MCSPPSRLQRDALQWLSPPSCQEPGIAPPPLPDLGRLTRRLVNGSPESEAVSAFDNRGRLLSQQLITPTRTGSAEYAWTDDGELLELHTQWNGGSWRGLRYDRAGMEGELTAVKSLAGATYASISDRDDLGRITQVELADGTLVERGYDLLGRAERASAMRGTGDLREQVYGYDHRGRLSGVETSDAIGVRATASYAYSEPGWLTDEVIVDGAGSRSTTYGHDVAGNRTSEAVTIGGVTTTRSLAYAYGNRLTAVDGVAVAWNAFGETTTDHRGADIDRAGDGAEVALSSVTGTALYAFTRGPGGEAVEVEEAVSGEVRSFLWGAGEADVPVSVLDEAGDDQATIAVEGLVVGRLDAGAFVGMAPDGRGGVLLDGSTFLEGAGAFGEGAEGAAGSSERRVWAMLERLPGTAYSLPRRRLYDAEVGRFASADPIGLAGGDHRFVYVGGNPTAGVDPSGLVASSFGMPMPTVSAAPYGGGGTGMGRMSMEVASWMGPTSEEKTARLEAEVQAYRERKAKRTEAAMAETDAELAGRWAADDEGEGGDEGDPPGPEEAPAPDEAPEDEPSEDESCGGPGVGCEVVEINEPSGKQPSETEPGGAESSGDQGGAGGLQQEFAGAPTPAGPTDGGGLAPWYTPSGIYQRYRQVLRSAAKGLGWGEEAKLAAQRGPQKLFDQSSRAERAGLDDWDASDPERDAAIEEAVDETVADGIGFAVESAVGMGVAAVTEKVVARAVVTEGVAASRSAGLAERFATSPERAEVLGRVITGEGGVNVSGTVAKQLAPGGSRSFIPTQSVLDTIGSGTRVADPQGVAGQFMYRAPASFNSSTGTLEVLVDEASGQVRHVLYTSGP